MLDLVRREEMNTTIMQIALTRCHFGEFVVFVGADNVMRTRIIKTYEFDREECPLYDSVREGDIENKPFLAFTPHISDDSRYLMIDNKKERFSILADAPRQVTVFEDVIVALYVREPVLDFFNLNTAVLKRIDLDVLMAQFEIRSGYFFRLVCVMRLRWSDRNTGLAGAGSNKIAVAGYYKEDKDGGNANRNFVVILAPSSPKASTIVLLDFEVTSLAFGPYDNAYLMLGGAGGNLAIVDPVSAEVLYDRRVMEGKISSISFDPTNLVLIAADDGAVQAVSLEKRKEHYVYIELGRKNYRTLKYPTKSGTPKISTTKKSLLASKKNLC